MTITVTPLETFRNETPYPFCPGCGHGPILDHLNRALVTLGRDPSAVVVVSDIGCSGLSDQYFVTNAFHGLHGRSVTYATGIKLANPELTVVVVMGDGGTGIGGTHLISAARRNIGITVLVMNNLNFGMTGGQHSTTTPEGAVTPTTPGGNLEHPLDVCATVGVNGAGYVYRGTGFDEDLAERIVEAIAHPGFALLDVWELCTAYFVRSNRMSRRGLAQTMAALGFEAGVLYRRETREYTEAYREASAGHRGRPVDVPSPVPEEFTSDLDRPFALTLAGSAGAKVRSAALLVADAAIRSGLWVTQKDDYPVTVKTGHSLSTLVISPEPEPLVPVPSPDAVVVLSDDGLRKVRSTLAGLPTGARVFATPGLAPFETPARVDVVDPSTFPAQIGKAYTAIAVTSAAVTALGLLSGEALLAAAAAGPFAEQNREAVEAAL